MTLIKFLSSQNGKDGQLLDRVSRICPQVLLGLLMAVSAMSPPCLVGQDSETAASQKQEPEWQTVKPTGALASFDMPGKPRYVERTFSPVKGRDPIKVKLHLATDSDGQVSYAVSYFDLPDVPADEETIERTLKGAIRGSLATVMGKLGQSSDIQYSKGDQKHRGKQFSYSFSQVDRQDQERGYVVVSRVYLVESRQYQLTVTMRQDAVNGNRKNAERFLNSFLLLKSESDQPPVPRNG